MNSPLGPPFKARASVQNSSELESIRSVLIDFVDLFKMVRDRIFEEVENLDPVQGLLIELLFIRYGLVSLGEPGKTERLKERIRDINNKNFLTKGLEKIKREFNEAIVSLNLEYPQIAESIKLSQILESFSERWMATMEKLMIHQLRELAFIPVLTRAKTEVELLNGKKPEWLEANPWAQKSIQTRVRIIGFLKTRPFNETTIKAAKAFLSGLDLDFFPGAEEGVRSEWRELAEIRANKLRNAARKARERGVVRVPIADKTPLPPPSCPIESPRIDLDS